MNRKIAVALLAACGAFGAARFALAGPPEVVVAVTGFSAKESCSCRFVVEQTQDYCRDFGQPTGTGLTATITFDDQARTSTATISAAGAQVTRVARMTQANGCLLDAPAP
jgi:hypothetical protein